MKKYSILKIISKIFIFSIIIFLYGCPNAHHNWDYEEGHFATEPVNLEFLNTQYDDYNSALNQSGESFPLCFSSNRNSSGANFDIVYQFMEINYDWETRDLYIGKPRYTGSNMEMKSNSLHQAMGKINGSSDEFGPFMLPIGSKESTDQTYYGQYFAYVFLYSNGESGNQDIRFVDNIDKEDYHDAKPVAFLNSSYDDAYPSFNREDSGLYFCSNRGGNFDIYFAKVDFSSQDWRAIFSDTTQKSIQKMDSLSSDSADKCPFIIGNTMVFASNRAGGYGGYDLYYSKFKNGKWSKAVNFGSKINTASDEYRPVIRREEGFSNDFMIFSSNRPGGKGGFDLYYVGVDKVPW